MKKANIYKVSVKDTSKKEGKSYITCIATSLSEAIDTACATFWNNDTGNVEYVKYKQDDVLEIKLIETNVYVQNYIPEYNVEEK